jgi:hypothetical protein
MSIDLVLALTLFLGATWVGLLNSIISTTRETPAERSLMVVAFMHFVVLVYFILAASVLYGRTIKAVTGRQWSRMPGYEDILVVTWPTALLSALIAYLATRLTGSVNPFVMVIPFLGIALLLLIWAKKNKTSTLSRSGAGAFLPLFACNVANLVRCQRDHRQASLQTWRHADNYRTESRLSFQPINQSDPSMGWIVPNTSHSGKLAYRLRASCTTYNYRHVSGRFSN